MYVYISYFSLNVCHTYSCMYTRHTVIYMQCQFSPYFIVINVSHVFYLLLFIRVYFVPVHGLSQLIGILRKFCRYWKTQSFIYWTDVPLKISQEYVVLFASVNE